MATFTEYGVCCDECVQAIANGDYTGLDYHYGPKAAEQRLNEILTGIEAAPGYLVLGDERDEFSTRRCDVCGTRLHGARTDVGYLTN